MSPLLYWLIKLLPKPLTSEANTSSALPFVLLLMWKSHELLKHQHLFHQHQVWWLFSGVQGCAATAARCFATTKRTLIGWSLQRVAKSTCGVGGLTSNTVLPFLWRASRTYYMPRSTTRMWKTLARSTSGISPLHTWDVWHMLTASGIKNPPIRPTREQRHCGEHPKPLSLHHVSPCIIL